MAQKKASAPAQPSRSALALAKAVTEPSEAEKASRTFDLQDAFLAALSAILAVQERNAKQDARRKRPLATTAKGLIELRERRDLERARTILNGLTDLQCTEPALGLNDFIRESLDATPTTAGGLKVKS